jgi:ABC-type multidrug transport system fused ATPase/permease subunit
MLEILLKANKLVSAGTRTRLIALTVFQSLLNFLDLAAIIGLGFLGKFVSSPPEVQGNLLPNFLLKFTFFQSTDSVVFILGLCVLLLFLLKNTAYLIISKKIFNCLQSGQNETNNILVGKLFSTNYSNVRSQNPHHIAYFLSNGLSGIYIGILATLIALTSEITLLIILFSFLVSLDWISSLLAFAYFIMILVILNLVFLKRISKLALDSMESSVKARELLMEFIKLFREIRISGNSFWFKMQYIGTKKIGIDAESKYSWFQQIPKAVIETSLIIGIFLVIVMVNAFFPEESRLSVIAIYSGVAIRLMPSLLKIQNSIFTLKNSLPGCKSTFDTLERIEDSKESSFLQIDESSDFNTSTPDFTASIELLGVSYSYPDRPNSLVLNSINLRFYPGERVVICGPSGSGKSTLADVLLGLLKPDVGSVRINGVESQESIFQDQYFVSYLPQDTTLFPGTILDNLMFGAKNRDEIESNLIRTLEVAQLKLFIDSLPLGLNTIVGTGSLQLSVGQRQRIGIARLLLQNPKVIVMDEVTSSLDALTENAFVDSLSKFDRDTLLIYVAHRLNVIPSFNRVVYMENGEIISDGSLQEAIETSKNFQDSASLFGIKDID